jgi:hypothetical protein
MNKHKLCGQLIHVIRDSIFPSLEIDNGLSAKQIPIST